MLHNGLTNAVKIHTVTLMTGLHEEYYFVVGFTKNLLHCVLLCSNVTPALQGSFGSLFFSDEHSVWITEVVFVMLGLLLRALDKSDNYQRPVFSLGVSSEQFR